jgi:hypothetical protein
MFKSKINMLGLGNRVASYFPSTVFESFPETKNLNRKNTIFTGPILNIDTKKVIEKNTNRNFTIGIQGGVKVQKK